MKKALSRAAALLLMLLLLCGAGTSAYAEFSYTSVDAVVPVGGTGTFLIKDAGAADEDAFDSITIEGSGSFTLSYDEPDDHSYEVFSTDAENTARYDVLVRVLVGSDDVLQPHVVVTESATGRKTPAALYPVYVDPPVKKIVTGEGAPNETFKFLFKGIETTAEGLDGKPPMPADAEGDSKTVTVVGAGENEAGPIKFDRVGTYVYEFTEIKGSTPGYSYDSSVFCWTFNVTESETGFQVEEVLSCNGAASTLTAATFVNDYKKPVNPTTGDGNNPLLWLALMGTSAALGLALLPLRRRETV